MGWSKTISVDVDIDIDDIIGEISTKDLEDELRSRVDTVIYDGNEVKSFIESLTGFRLFSLSDDEICDVVLKALGRR